jgi:hypothetical protein
MLTEEGASLRRNLVITRKRTFFTGLSVRNIYLRSQRLPAVVAMQTTGEFVPSRAPRFRSLNV